MDGRIDRYNYMHLCTYIYIILYIYIYYTYAIDVIDVIKDDKSVSHDNQGAVGGHHDLTLILLILLSLARRHDLHGPMRAWRRVLGLLLLS